MEPIFVDSVGLRVATFASAEEYLDQDGPASTECLTRVSYRHAHCARRRRRSDRIQAMDAGAMAFLRKPCDSEVLLAAVEAAR
jgi:FixJ family two-component response regulator